MNTNFWELFESNPMILATGWALVHFLWQGLLLGGIVALIRLGVSSQASQARYGLSLAGFAGLAVLPVATFWYEYPLAVKQVAAQGETQLADQPLECPQTLTLEPGPSSWVSNSAAIELSDSDPPVEAVVPPMVVRDGPDEAKGSEPAAPWSGAQSLLPWCVMLWLIGVMVLGFRIILGLLRVRRWYRTARPITDSKLSDRFAALLKRMKLSSRIRLCESMSTSVPAVIGWMRPVILLPTSMASGLTPSEFDSILAHELAHIRRNDYLVNMIQTVIETILFYHPVVWWMSSLLRADREHCCDDQAAAVCGDRLVLASALVHMEEIRCRNETLALAANGGSLLCRIQRLVETRPRSAPWWPAGLGLLIVLCAVTSGVSATWVMSLPGANSSNESGPAKVVSQESSDEESSSDANRDEATHPKDRPTQLREVTRVDRMTGLEQQLFPGIELTSHRDDVTIRTTLDMKYANTLSYTFIPARVARELNLIELGEIDFGERPQRGLVYQTMASDPVDAAEVNEVSDEHGEETQPLTVADVTRPVGDTAIVPYSKSEEWAPGILASYGMNSADQRKFKVVRLSGADLGIGPKLGPINALVLNDENSEFGILGRDWAQVPRGAKGESIWFTADGTLHFVATKDVKLTLSNQESTDSDPSPPPSSEPSTGVMRVESSDVGSVHPRVARPEIKVIRSHNYATATRTSTGWVEVDGAQVPVDQGQSHDGKTVLFSLFFDLFVVDDETREVIWKKDWSKTQPIWQWVSIVELPVEGESVAAVELFAADEGLQSMTYRYYRLEDGSEVAYKPPQVVSKTSSHESLLEAWIDVIASTDNSEQHLVWGAIDQAMESNDRLEEHVLNSWYSHIAKSPAVVVQGQARYLLSNFLEADEVEFNLPLLTKTEVHFIGEKVTVTQRGDAVELTVTHGTVEWRDDQGGVRAKAFADGGAEQIVVIARQDKNEFHFTLRSQRLEADPEYPRPPINVRFDTTQPEPDEQELSEIRLDYWLSEPNDENGQTVRLLAGWRRATQSDSDEGSEKVDLPVEERSDEVDTTHATIQALCRDNTKLLDWIESLGDWIKDDELRFDSRGYMVAAHCLMQLPEDQRLAVLGQLAQRENDAQLFVLCRMLFEPREGQEFRAPRLGQPSLVGTDTKRATFPLEPILIVDQVPLLVVRGYTLAGRQETGAEYLEYCQSDCLWTKCMFEPIEQQLVAAYKRLPELELWGERTDVDEWIDLFALRNQITPTVLLRIGKYSWIAEATPYYLLNANIPVSPASIAKEIEQLELPSPPRVYLLVEDSALYVWVTEMINTLNKAEVSTITLIRRGPSVQEMREEAVEKETAPESNADGGEEDVEWGPELEANGLRLQLSVADPRVAEGQPLLAKLMIRNFGDEPIAFDPQFYVPFRVVRIWDQNDDEVQFIGNTPQTSGFEIELAPGESHLLWKDVDLTSLYLLSRGNYDVQIAAPSRHQDTLPQSRRLSFEITEGELPPLQRLAQQLPEVLPDEWEFSLYPNALVMSHSPSNLKRDVTTVQIWFTEEALPDDYQLGKGDNRQIITRLGKCELGYVNLAAMPNSQTLWPEYAKALDKAIRQTLAFDD